MKIPIKYRCTCTYRNTDVDFQITSIIHGIQDINVQNIEVQLYNRVEN